MSISDAATVAYVAWGAGCAVVGGLTWLLRLHSTVRMNKAETDGRLGQFEATTTGRINVVEAHIDNIKADVTEIKADVKTILGATLKGRP